MDGILIHAITVDLTGMQLVAVHFKTLIQMTLQLNWIWKSARLWSGSGSDLGLLLGILHVSVHAELLQKLGDEVLVFAFFINPIGASAINPGTQSWGQPIHITLLRGGPSP